MGCTHFPNKMPNECSLCYPSADYEILPKMWGNEPVIEILRDGASWLSLWDKEFQFGRVKTAMILYTIDIIERFAVTPTPERMLSLPIIEKPDPDLTIQLQTFPAFTNSYGIVVEEPFLRLDRIYNGKMTLHIGFGQPKAAALVILKNDLRDWLQSVRGWYR